MSLESDNLKGIDKNIYNLVKNKLVSRYPYHHNKFNFNGNKSLISFVDSVLNKYSTYTPSAFLENPVVASRKITNISSIASSESDAKIMAEVMLAFISSCEAAMVNGGLKIALYGLSYISDYTTPVSTLLLVVYGLIGSYINSLESTQHKEVYLSVIESAELVVAKYRSDVAFSVISYCFEYVYKLIYNFYSISSTDARLKGIAYKQSINTLQSLMKNLVNLYFADFYELMLLHFENFNNDLSDIFVSTKRTEVLDNLISNFSYFRAEKLSITEEKTAQEIAKNLISKISSLKFDTTPDITEFSAFIETLDDSFFMFPKEDLPERLYLYIKGSKN